MNARWKTFLAGTALIVLANAVALVGVYLNRSGEPESRLQLTQRELGHPWGWRGGKENSGLALNLQWRVIDVSAGDDFFPHYGNHGGSPAWLDERRLAELGFDVSVVQDYSRRRAYERQMEREVLVVLELAGPAWESVQLRARENLARHEAARQANPDAREFIEREKNAREQLAREETQNSRLFAVDAGLDLAALRAKYPDRGRYMILKGKLRPHMVTRNKKTVVGAYLGELGGTRINVPHALRPLFETVLQTPSRQRRLSPGTTAPFTVVVSVGRRFEPWIEMVGP